MVEPTPRPFESLAIEVRDLDGSTHADLLQGCIDRVAALWTLTPRQRGVLGCIVRGHKNRDIGRELGISERTVEVHVSAILDRAGMESRSALVAATLLHADPTRVTRACEHWALRARQREVLDFVVRGEPNHLIAKELRISERAVEMHVSTLLDRAGVASRSALGSAIFAIDVDASFAGERPPLSHEAMDPVRRAPLTSSS